jgi:hypothetical protein
MLLPALCESGAGGVPMEHLNPKHLGSLLRPLTRGAVESYLQDVKASRTLANGVFGMKIQSTSSTCISCARTR